MENAECNLMTCKLPKKILPMQAQNAYNILLSKLFNAHKKKNIRHNRNRKPAVLCSLKLSFGSMITPKYLADGTSFKVVSLIDYDDCMTFLVLCVTRRTSHLSGLV